MNRTVQGWNKIGDPILHIEVSFLFTDALNMHRLRSANPACITSVQLRRWADIVLIAPLSANTLAKLSNGICDNLLVCSSPLQRLK